VKIRHRIPKEANTPNQPVIDADYQAEIDRTMEKARLHAERDVRRAQRELDKAKSENRPRLRLDLDARLKELHEIESLMTQTPAGSSHRGTKSFRPAPPRRNQ